MKRAVHAREPSYGQVANFVMTGNQHHREVSYGGVTEQFGQGGDEMFEMDQQMEVGGPPQPQPSTHSRDLSYGGLRDKFEEENDPPELMAKLQEEVFRVMDVHEWSKITKGMVVEEVQNALGVPLKPYHKRFIKITIMRIIDGKLKLECFAGEAIKQEVVAKEQGFGMKHQRDISYGGVQAATNYDGQDDPNKFEELDSIFNKAENNNAASKEAVLGGGFNTGPSIEVKTKEEREKEKEIVRQTRRHSRNVSYGGVRELDLQDVDDGGDGDIEVVTVTTKGGSAAQYLNGGGFKGGPNAERLNELEMECVILKEKVNTLQSENDRMKLSKIMLVEAAALEIERLRKIIMMP